ncbi:MAG: imidazole glycerol phosphate synthase subunit HisH [Pseudomonadota bacterium]
MKVAIIDYGSGNLRSAQKAFERAAKEADLTAKVIVTSDPDTIADADRVVLPGVGAYADCRAGLDAVDGLLDALNEAVVSNARPFFGICVGMQLMAERGLEKTTTKGFGWIGGDVIHMQPHDPSLKIPQIGWNTLEQVNAHPLLDGIEIGEAGLHAYFVHSYHLDCTNPDEKIAWTDYGGQVTAIVGRDNLIGTQFHPEKSQRLGLALISNFLRWKP